MRSSLIYEVEIYVVLDNRIDDQDDDDAHGAQMNIYCQECP